MWGGDPQERRLYQARLKAERDAISNVEYAHVEERIDGKKEMVRMLQDILKLPLSSDQDLQSMTLDELQILIADLREKVRDRQSRRKVI